MKISKQQLRRIIKEELATVTDDSIEDVVMGVLSDEGGAAGAEPIEDALENLEDDAISLPDEDIEDIIDNVPGVKRHADGDYIDTTQLEGKSMKLTKRQLRQIIKEEKAKILAESVISQTTMESVDRVLNEAWNEMQESYVVSEGYSEEEASELAAQDLMGLVDGFMDSIGFRGKFGRPY